jgi:hypothetical protein
MAEHRSSISSNGPAFLSMSLQQLNDLEEGPPLASITTYTKQDNVSSSDKTRSGLLKSSSSSANGIGTNKSGNPAANSSSGSKQPVPVTATAPSLSSSLYLDNSADDIVIGNSNGNSNSETVTIDMIQTLPIFDAAAYSNNGDVYNNSLRCYISNMIMPSTNCKSTCTIHGATSLSGVLHKINDFLRIQCIAYTIQYTPTTVAFHCERNSAFASLVGPSLVFVIYLWFEEHAPKSENDGVVRATGTSSCKPILIDVQRRRGCPLDLQCLRRSLFRSLLDPESTTELVVSRQGMIPLDICRSIWSKNNASKENDDATTSTETASQVDLDGGQEHVTAEAMETLLHYQSMLDLANTVENHRMGLECLCQHTDATVTDVTKSKAVVQAIVCGPSKGSREGIDDPYDSVVKKFRSSLLHFISKVDSPEVTQVLATAGCAPKNLQCLAFRALYTSLNTYISTMTTIENDPPHAVLFIENDHFWQTALQTCRRGIVTSNTAPCFATMSIVLICTLLSAEIVSQPFKEMIYDMLCPNNDSSNLCDELKSAHAWGQQHHTFLESNSQRLLDLLACRNDVRL